MSMIQETDAKRNERADYVTGLRQLATFIETHPDLPLPGLPLTAIVCVETKEELATVARTAGVRWHKDGAGDYFALRGRFEGQHEYAVFIPRGEVCTAVVVGTKTIPAQPERTIDDVRWECLPIFEHEVTA